MKNTILIATNLACAVLLPAQNVVIHPHPEDPFAPMYFRVFVPDEADNVPYDYVPFWAMRPLHCVPSDFVLNDVYDTTPGKAPFALRAWACPLVVTGWSVYADESDLAALRPPLFSQLEGRSAVQVIFVPRRDFNPSTRLTSRQLMDIPTKLMGLAWQYTEKLFPQPTPAGGGAKLPGLEISANGVLFDGRKFDFYVKSVTTPDKPNRTALVAWKLEFKAP
jgi:hypothetical protein